MNDIRRDVAIAGIGFSTFGHQPEVPVEVLALTACQNALLDAGISPADLDGLVCLHSNDSILARDLAPALAIRELNWWSDVLAGGVFSCAVVVHAAMAIASGMARTILIYRALRGRSGKRMGRYRGALTDGVHQFMTPYGFSGPAQIFGMICRRHMVEFGTTKEQLGAVAIQTRENARSNERAMRRESLGLNEYLASRIIADPLNLFDCCQETDGACALVLTSADRAQLGPHEPVHILGAVHGGGSSPRIPFDAWPSLTSSAFRRLAPELLSATGLAPSDFDVAFFYDAFTFEVIQQLEDFGFCGLGEGGHFVEEGHIARGGTIPVNPHGGLLSEGYIHGLNHVCAAVEDVRGHSLSRPIDDASVALVTGYGFSAGSAMALGKADVL